MAPQTEFCIVLVTAPNESCAHAIAQIILTEKLAACVNCFAIESFYTWDNQLNQDQEFQLIIKTQRQHFAALTKRIQDIHPYEVPEVLAIPILAGSPSYLNWLQQNTPPV